MKALVCTACMDIRGLPNSGDVTRWVACSCSNARARWREPSRGTVDVQAQMPEYVRILGLNNQMLTPALRAERLTHEQRRALHDLATDAPDHVFDKSRACCWAVVFRVGETSDTQFVEKGE